MTEKRLVSHFSSTKLIIAHKDQSSVVCSSDITVGEMFELVAKLKEQLDDATLRPNQKAVVAVKKKVKRRCVTAGSDIYAVGKHIRKELKER